MKATVRRCVQCGRDDTGRTWPSIEDAANDGALRSWTCPTCAWTEAELVEVEASTTGASGAQPAPVPDEARHPVAGSPRGG